MLTFVSSYEPGTDHRQFRNHGKYMLGRATRLLSSSSSSSSSCFAGRLDSKPLGQVLIATELLQLTAVTARTGGALPGTEDAHRVRSFADIFLFLFPCNYCTQFASETHHFPGKPTTLRDLRLPSRSR